MTRTVAWFHPFSGIAGDMALGACVDAGADPDHVLGLLGALDLPGWSVRFDAVLRGGIAATHAVVTTDDDVHGRTAAEIIALVDRAPLPGRVRDRAVAVFTRLAEVEGRLHRLPAESVHLHEVGGVDAIVDVVGTCAALESLGVDEVVCGPVATGTGLVRTSHGLLPVPAPAVAALLSGAPVVEVDVPHELTTPTGAALMATLADHWGPLPAMTVRRAGYGAGTRELPDRPNAVQVVIGDAAARSTSRPGAAQPLVELAVNIDDATGETLAHAVAALLDAGALDAWITPALMKKGRPGHVVSALCDPATTAAVSDVLIAETGSFGVRATAVDRWSMARRFETVDVDGHPVRIKIAPARTKVEHDDAAAVARSTGRPLREVVSLAEEAARRKRHPPEGNGPDEPA